MQATIELVWDPRRAIQWALDEDGETQAELARRAEIDPSKLNRILKEKAKTLDIYVLDRIATAQNRPLDFYTNPPKVKVSHNPRNATALDWAVRPIQVYAGHGSLQAA